LTRPLVAAFICAVLVSLLAAGCTSDQGATSADCAAAIRRDGIVYIEAGFAKHPATATATATATASGQAERAECHDVGRDAPGIAFPPDGKSVNVVAFRTAIRPVFVAEGVASEPVMNALKRDMGG